MSDNETLKNENRSRDNGTVSSDGSYRYIRPESQEMLYRDANVEPADEDTRLPRHYTPNQKSARDKAKPEPNTADTQKAAAPVTKKAFWTRLICVGVVCALLGGLTGGGIAAVLMEHRMNEMLANHLPAPVNADEGNNCPDVVVTPSPADIMTPAEIYHAACEQVVGITTEISYHNMFGMPVSQPVSGTGFFISEDGYLLTNYHVIEYAAEYGSPAKVITHDGTEYTAAIVGTDPDNDVAVLQVDAGGLTYATLGNSDGIRVGDSVYAVGNPLGELQFSMTTGSVSATDRLISTKDALPAINMFQIDAAVNQGNSGGPVYDITGEVIGIVTAKYSQEGIEGLGFAIPINDAVSIATDLITTGYVTGKAKLGVDAQTMSARAAKYYNTVQGAYIRYIDPGSCAETAGLELGDVIYRFGDLDVATRDDLQAAVKSYHAGDTVDMQVYRDSQHLTISVTLDEDIPEGAAPSAPPVPGPVAYSRFANSF